ncbi:hypothetical protein ACIRJR_15880 [Streptomyces sp. NPDC102402]|uniref:hypothetical protein n=1 Tax=Streptomyces sp. NPDC102402 TaxID=3366169 RepID=UPI00380EBD9F
MESPDDLLGELSRTMAALTTGGRVYVRTGRYTEAAADMGELTAQIHELLVQVFEDESWRRFLSPAEPMPPRSIEASLEPVEGDAAAALLASLASVDIVWPSHRLLDREVALRTAAHAVSLLGDGATWWTNHDAHCGATNLVTPVFDSLVAGTDGEYYVMALQVADD